MTLNPAQLASDLAECARNPADSVGGCAASWANAIGSYASAVVPPSSTASAAQSTLQGALAGAFASPDAAPLMETAMLAFGVTLGGGMVPLIAVPPVAPVGFAQMFASHAPSHEAAGAQLAQLIDTWMRTGTATTPPPASVTSPWS